MTSAFNVQVCVHVHVIYSIIVHVYMYVRLSRSGLHVACQKGHDDLVDYLVRSGADRDIASGLDGSRYSIIPHDCHMILYYYYHL